MKVMIYSNEHKMWWRPNYWGYTGFIPVLGSIPLFITGINLQ